MNGCYPIQYLEATEQPLKIYPEYENYYDEFIQEGEEKIAVAYHYLKTEQIDGTFKIRVFYPETKQLLMEQTYKSKYYKIWVQLVFVPLNSLSFIDVSHHYFPST